MKTDRERKNAAIVVIRWSARILGLIIAAPLLLTFIGGFLIGNIRFEKMELFGAIALALMGIYGVAMFLALKWERLGSLLGVATLGGFFVIMFLGLLPGYTPHDFSYRGILNPILLAFWLPILLYLLSWGLEKLGARTNE